MMNLKEVFNDRKSSTEGNVRHLDRFFLYKTNISSFEAIITNLLLKVYNMIYIAVRQIYCF